MRDAQAVKGRLSRLQLSWKAGRDISSGLFVGAASLGLLSNEAKFYSAQRCRVLKPRGRLRRTNKRLFAGQIP